MRILLFYYIALALVSKPNATDMLHYTVAKNINFSQSWEGNWNGYLLGRSEPNNYDLSFNFAIDKITDSITGTMTLGMDIPIKSKQFSLNLNLRGKIFGDSLYLLADTSYKLNNHKRYENRFRFFAKCMLETDEKNRSRFMQGVFIDSAQFQRTSKEKKTNNRPYYGMFLVESNWNK